MEKSCHPSASRCFTCACGEWYQWAHTEKIQVCHTCQRVHRRGTDGPKKASKPCEGTGETMTFGKAVAAARHEFMRAMYILGYQQEREGRMKLSDHNASKRSKYTGFTVEIAEHFGGEGRL